MITLIIAIIYFLGAILSQQMWYWYFWLKFPTLQSEKRKVELCFSSIILFITSWLGVIGAMIFYTSQVYADLFEGKK